MYRIKYKMLAMGLALLMCASVLIAAFLPEGGKAGGNMSAGTNDGGFSITEDDSLALADTSSAFDQSLTDIAPEVSGKQWLIVSLEGESLADRRGNKDLSEFAETGRGKSIERSLQNEQADFLDNLRGAGIPYELKYSYTMLTNAVAIRTDVKYAEKIATMKGVSSVNISEYYYAPQDEEVSNNANVWGTGIYKVDEKVANEYSKGMVAAVLDTGIDSSHEVFQVEPEEPSLSKEMVAERVFNGVNSGVQGLDPDVTADDVYYNSKIPFAYDYADKDTDVYPSYSAHGTHVAGIIAGSPVDNIVDQDGKPILDQNNEQMDFRGVAPQAQLVICKVFTDNADSTSLGGAEEMDILAALEDCVKLKVDVINMSLGSSAGFSTGDNEHMQEVYDSIRAAGISLVVAASNDYSAHYGGTYGTNRAEYPDSATVGSPSTYPGSLSVASINGQQSKYIKVTVGGEDKYLYFTEASDASGEEKDFVAEMKEKNPGLVNQSTGDLTVDFVVVPGYGNISNYSRVNVDGKVAVVSRGGNVSFEQKVRNAMQRGAVGCVIYNNVSGIIRMSLGNISNPIPTCSITMDAASNIINAGSGTMVISESQKAGPFMSDFSSWGPTPELHLKPEISAHGGEITSSVPNGWAEYSGTSMASPNMAGAMSLIISYIEHNEELFTPGEAGSMTDSVAISNFLVMSTATIARDEYANPYSPRKQGAGLADIAKAIKTQAYLYQPGIDKAKIEVGDDPEKTGEYTLTFHARNLSARERTYALGTKTMTETLASDGLTVAERSYMLNNMTEVSFSGEGVVGSTLTLAPYADVKITCTVKLNDAAKNYIDESFVNGMYVEGFVTLKDTTGDENSVDMNIPWLGFYGDWYAAPMFDISDYELGEALADDSIPDDEKPEAAIYPTIPLGSYWGEEYIIPLGSYLYTQDPNVQQIYPSADKASISIYDDANHHTVHKLYGIYTGLLRGAKEMKMTITDAVTGEVVYEGMQKNVRKSFTGGSSTAHASLVEMDWDPKALGLENNRQYLFHMEGLLPDVVDPDSPDGVRKYDPSQYEYGKSFDFNFYIDTEAPEIVDYRVRYDVRTNENDEVEYSVYLDVDIYDNHYAQSVALCFADYTEMQLEMLDSQMTPVYSERNSITTVTLDITDYYDQDVDMYLQVDDYALNARAYRINDFKSLADAVNYPEQIDIVTGTDVEGNPDYSKQVEIGVNEALSIQTAVSPADAANVNLYWHSFDESIVRVQDGEIFGVSPGTTIVRVYGGKDEYAEASDGILVTVTENEAAAPGVKRLELGLIENADNNMVNPTNTTVSVHPNESFRLNATIEPWYADIEPDIRWTSSVPQVATVDAVTGYVNTLSEGTTTITGTLYINGRPSLYAVWTQLSVGPEFVVDNGYLREYHGKGGKVTIPKRLNVYYIYEDAFRDNANITELEISAPCTEIQSYAFANMKALKRVVLPDTVEYVHSAAFLGCSNLEQIDLHSRSITFGNMCFAKCTSLKYINNVELKSHVDGKTAEILSLEEGKDFTRIPANLTSVGRQAFSGCTSLQDLDITELRVAGEGAFLGCTALQTVTLSRFTAISSDMFYGCSNLTTLIYTDLTPELIGTISYAGAESPFGGCKIDTILLKDGSGNTAVMDPETDAVYSDAGKTVLLRVSQNVKSFVLPSTVEVIGANVFSGNEGLTSVDFSDAANLREIGAYAFSGTGLQSVAIPASVTTLGRGAFSWCEDLSQVDLSAYAGDIPRDAFYNSGVSSVQFGAKTESVGAQAFMNTALRSLDLTGTNISALGNSAFANCPLLTEVKLGVIASLGDGVFATDREGSLESVSFAKDSSALGTYTFAGQSNLTVIALPASLQSLTEIGAGVFSGCGALTSLPFVPTSVGDSAFDGCTALATLDLSQLKEAGNAAFRNCAVLNVGTLPNLISAGNEAFFGCEKLTQASMNGVTFIGAHAFENTSLSSLTLNDNIQTIGKYAFANTLLTGENGVLTIPAGVTTIGEGAYSGLASVESFAIGDNEKYFVESGMLYQRVPNGVQLIAFPAGSDGDNGKVELNAQTVRLGASAFENAKKIESVEFPYVFKSIGDRAFFGSSAETYIFGCLTAPVLETQVLYAEDFEAGSDMYLILSMSGSIASEKYYANFKDYAAKKIFAGKDGVKGIEDFGLTLRCPENAIGYDGYIYSAYFSTVERTPLIADDTARNAQAAIEKLPTPEAIRALSASETQTWKDYRALVSAAREAYNIVNAVQSQFVKNSDTLYEVETAMRERAKDFGETVTQNRLIISQMPDKMAYLRGEKFDPAGMVLLLVWSDGSREVISDSEYTIYNGDALSMDNPTVIIEFNGLQTPLNVTVSKPAIQSVSVASVPEKEYRPGDMFSKSGIRLNVLYADGIEETVSASSEIEIVDPKPLTEGENVITLSYRGFTTTYTVTVKAVDGGTNDPTPPPVEGGCSSAVAWSAFPAAGMLLAAVLVVLFKKKRGDR